MMSNPFSKSTLVFLLLVSTSLYGSELSKKVSKAKAQAFEVLSLAIADVGKEIKERKSKKDFRHIAELKEERKRYEQTKIALSLMRIGKPDDLCKQRPSVYSHVPKPGESSRYVLCELGLEQDPGFIAGLLIHGAWKTRGNLNHCLADQIAVRSQVRAGVHSGYSGIYCQ